MRLASLRIITALSLALLASCIDAFRGTSPTGGVASLAIVPRFSDQAALTSATLSAAGLEYDNVRIVITRPPNETLKDTTIAFTPASAALTLELGVAALPQESLVAAVEFRQGTTVIFSGSATVKAVATSVSAVATPVEIEVEYAGPGATATKVAISPGGGLYSSNNNTQFTAKAFDAGNVELPNTPVSWSVSDETLATITSAGVLTPKGTRGSLRVRAISANGVGDSINVQLTPAAAGLRVVQGASQRGPAGATLPVPVIIEAVGPDGLPAPGGGLTVTFTANGGALISPASSGFDANGRAQATMKLGTTAGTTYIYTATAGAFSISWAGIAAAGTPTHFVVSGSTTLTLTAGVVPNPVPTLRVADALENPVPGQLVKVTIRNQAGADVVSPFTVPVDSIGLLEVYKVAPTVAGTYTILVEADPSLAIPPVTYNVTVNPGAAEKLAFTQQPSNIVANAAMTPAVKVTVQDKFGNTVTSAANQNIAISIDPATGSGVTFVGTGSETLINGTATFSNLKFTGAKTGVKIQAIGFSLPAVLSAAFNITP